MSNNLESTRATRSTPAVHMTSFAHEGSQALQMHTGFGEGSQVIQMTEQQVRESIAHMATWLAAQ